MSVRTIQMALRVYAQTDVADPRFVEVTEVGLTRDKDITTEDIVFAKGHEYNVMYVVPT